MDTFLLELDEIYTDKGLDLKQALDNWKQARFTAEQIARAVFADTDVYLTRVEAKFLQRSGKEIYEDNKMFAAFYGYTSQSIEKQKDVERKLATARRVRFTPEVRRAIEKIGPNTFRTKRGSVEWSIILVDGQPHLARRDTPDEKEKTAIPDSDIK